MTGEKLEISSLSVSYRSVPALRNVSLDVDAGQITAILGANGAGKSTLLRAISGTLSLHGGSIDAGTISYGARRIDGADPADIVRAGIVQVPEGRRVFGALTVEDNLRAGQLGARRRTRTADPFQRVFELFPVLRERRRQSAGLLSGGEQQMLAMGRALMAEPSFLLLDEPSLGLAPKAVADIATIIRRIGDQGVPVLLVEQNAALALSLSGSASVLDVGEVRLSGAAADLADSDEVRKLYLGESDDAGEAVPTAAALSRWSS
jgi:branched-chain amino acid transport system ATP-binding protein